MLSYKMQDGQTIWEFLNQKPDEADVLRNSKISTHIYFLLVTCTVPYVFIFDVIPESGHSETQQYWLNVLFSLYLLKSWQTGFAVSLFQHM
ncbi:hypothetical protein EB796_024192 [Bugula neritina]|uniref:Uncharacterized protein n=1 Tax=Bugula neritina TaxID=10212 RepID=A0A7J7IVS0_BUGNE|nr:hypothetical protein EB796_024192 [Bugula neritina]